MVFYNATNGRGKCDIMKSGLDRQKEGERDTHTCLISYKLGFLSYLITKLLETIDISVLSNFYQK